MKKYSFTESKTGRTWERITKKQARAAYMNGLTVAICPVNFRLFTPWRYPYTTNRKSREQFIVDDTGARNDFNNVVASFEYYNCTNTETGKYAAFYIPVKTVDRFTGDAPTAETCGTVKQYDISILND